MRGSHPVGMSTGVHAAGAVGFEQGGGMKCRKQSHSMALFSPRVPTSRKVYPGRSRNTFVYWSFLISAAGFENERRREAAQQKPLQQAVDVVLEEQRHLPRERCGAEQVDVLHPLHGVGLVRLLKAGNKGLPQIVHVHAADGDAADALRLVGKILNIVAGGIVADEQVDGRAERPHQPVLGVGAHSVGAEGGVVRERKEPFAAPDARQRKGTGAGRAVDQINRLVLDLCRQVGKPIAPRAETLGVDPADAG